MPLSVDGWGFVGGDAEPPRLAMDLRDAGYEIVLAGRNSGHMDGVENPWEAGLTDELREALRLRGSRKGIIEEFDRLTQPVFDSLDGLVLWIGQHGPSNSYIPAIGAPDGTFTYAQESSLYYGSYLIRGANLLRDKGLPVVYLCADARNYMKARDVKWPCSPYVLGQYNYSRTSKHYRYGDYTTPPPDEWSWDPADANGSSSSKVWVGPTHYRYSGLELCSLGKHIGNQFSDEFASRNSFGLFINEADIRAKPSRKDIVRDWVLPLEPSFIHGEWTAKSREELRRDILPAPHESYYDLLRSVKCTFTTPSSGSGWATTKPWEAYAAGTVCFFHPAYDTQKHIPTHAAQRVASPDELRLAIAKVSSSKQLWEEIVQFQHEQYELAVADWRHVKEIACLLQSV